jgi:hypothetical protein
VTLAILTEVINSLSVRATNCLDTSSINLDRLLPNIVQFTRESCYRLLLLSLDIMSSVIK